MKSIKGHCKCGTKFSFKPEQPFNLYHCGENVFIFDENIVLECAVCSKTVSVKKDSPFPIRCECRNSVYRASIEKSTEDKDPDEDDNKDPDEAMIYEDDCTVKQLKSFVKLKNLEVSHTGKTVEQLRVDVRKAWEASPDNPKNNKEE